MKTLIKKLHRLNELFIESAQSDLEILRISIIAEMDASSLYERMAKQAKDSRVKEVLLSVSQEEKVHVGEFEALLKDLDKEFIPAIDDGAKEVKEIKNYIENDFGNIINIYEELNNGKTTIPLW